MVAHGHGLENTFILPIDKRNLYSDPNAKPKMLPVIPAKQDTGKGKPDSPIERTPVVRCMADIEPVEVQWLWPHRIPLGRLTLLSGRPGEGKTFVTIEITACVSTGRNFPDCSLCPLGDVLIVSAEDDPADTIRPRLDAAGADVNRVHILSAVQYTASDGKKSERSFTLADVPMLEAAIVQFPECKLIIIDPIGSYLGGRVDAHRDNEVRGVLSPVAALAAKYNLAVVIVAHTRKSAADAADDTVLGSRAFTGIARSVWHLSHDTEDKARRLLLPGKNNLTAAPDGLAFRLEGKPIARVVWEDGPVSMDADEANFKTARNAAERRKPGPSADGRQKAAQWLGEALENGPQTPKELQAKADKAGHKWRTVDRAAEELGIVRERTGFGGGMLWYLPVYRSKWEPDLLAYFQEANGEAREFSALATALEAKVGEKPRNAEVLAVVDEWIKEGTVERTGHGGKKDPYLYRFLGEDHSRQDAPAPSCQVPQVENNLATWQECENKPETPDSDPDTAISAKMPNSPSVEGKAAKLLFGDAALGLPD